MVLSRLSLTLRDSAALRSPLSPAGTRWGARAMAAVAGLGLALVVPALAWAASSPAVLAAAEEAQRRRFPRVGGIGLLCCLAVVAVIVVLAVLAMRRRRPPRR